MIALKNYIRNKFDFSAQISIGDTDEWVTLDSAYYNDLFDSVCLSFDLKELKIYGDLPVENYNVNTAINILKKNFVIEEIHEHLGQKHIHIKGTLTKNVIDILSDILR